MKISHWLAGATIAAALSAAVAAQQAPTGFHTVGCYKLKPDMAAEFRKFAADDIHKVAQARIDMGLLSAYYLLRSVMPTGTSADCDYLIVAFYPGAPPEPLSQQDIAAALKRAGSATTAQEYVDRRSALTTLVASNMYRSLEYVGSARKGAYLTVAYMKTANLEEWIKFEQSVWKPLAEQMIKDGVQSGWSLNIRAFGQDSDLPYQGVTVDTYPNWDAIWTDDAQFEERFKKVHPDMDMNSMWEKAVKMRTMTKQELYAIDDLITAATK